MQQPENVRITCTSTDCPERKSICCDRPSQAASEPERMLGVPEFFCSGCGKEYQGWDCSAAKDEDENPYCNKCGGCGFIGCCGVRDFLEKHVRGKTDCKLEGIFIDEIIDNYDEENSTD